MTTTPTTPATPATRSAPMLRILTTNDIFGGFFTVPTSYGILPGGHALTATVDRLRDQATVARWIDAGDFSGGGPLAPASQAALSWDAACTLGIDLAVPGNHEFDYGDDAFVDHANAHPLALMATDLHDHPDIEAGIAPWTMIDEPGVPPVAVLGLNFPERRGIDVYDVPTDHATAIARVRAAAAEARAAGATSVLVAMHEGVPALPAAGDRAPGGQFTLIRELCRALRGTVDAIIGGHTCAHFVGDIEGMPFLQPWSYGAEVGILDIDPDGIHLSTAPVRARDAAEWTGPGAELHQQLKSQVIGELNRPLTTPETTDTDDLRDAVAQGLIARCGADVAIVHASDVGCVQPAVDGCVAYLPAGPVTEADLFRILPWADGDLGDAVYVADLAPAEVTKLVAGFTSEDNLRPGLAQRARGGQTLVSRNYLGKATRLLERNPGWQRAGLGQRDGLRHWLSDPHRQP